MALVGSTNVTESSFLWEVIKIIADLIHSAIFFRRKQRKRFDAYITTISDLIFENHSVTIHDTMLALSFLPLQIVIFQLERATTHFETPTFLQDDEDQPFKIGSSIYNTMHVAWSFLLSLLNIHLYNLDTIYRVFMHEMEMGQLSNWSEDEENAL